MQAKEQDLDYQIDPSFQGAKRLCILPFEENTVRKGHKGLLLQTVEIKDQS